LIVYKAVRYKNFFATGNQFTEVQLNQNKTTLIIGDNGAGKSTVLEAISYAMYGRPMRSVNKPLMVNSINNKNMLVELEFSVGTKNYMIRRGMKPNIFEIFLDGNLLNQDSASKDYQEVLETQILKRNHKSFCQIDVLSMANYTPFMKLTAAGRREVIEDLLDIEIFSLMNTLLKDKISQNKEAHVDADYQIKLLENNIERHQHHIIEMNLNHQETIDAKRSQIAAYNTEIAKMDARVQEVFGEIQKLTEQTQESAAVRKKLSSKVSSRKTISEKCEHIKRDIAFYETNTSCPTCKQEIEESFKVGEINKKTELLTEADKTVQKLESSISSLRETVKTFEALNEQIADLNREASELTIKISTNQRFMASIEAEIKTLEAKINEAHTDNSELKALQDQLVSANTRKEALTKDREILTMAGQLLKDGGIKSKIIKQYVPVDQSVSCRDGFFGSV
jgi:DNA repair exonuclease SbcCD ATPase subunit